MYGLVMFLLLLALVALAAFSAWRLTHPATATVGAAPAATPTAAKPADPALAELRLRYARGEVERDDYLQRVADLGGVAPPSDSPPSDA